MRKVLLITTVLFVLVLQACGQKLPIETNMNEKVADFSFTTQDNELLQLDDLKGQWWIADFIFTNCTSVCLPMTANMSYLQDRLNEEGLPIQLVSFSVDPDFDSPEVLKAYGEQYDADFTNWSFLTGYEFQTIKELSIKSFRAYLKEPEPGSDQFTHDTRFFLVDPKGKIVKGYNGVQRENIDLLIDDLLTLQNEKLIENQS